LSKNCAEASKGICIQCFENYHLGLDNKCTNIDKCIYSDFYGECTECENNNYYNRSNKLCEIEKENFENCKITTFDGNFCDKCKKDFYYNKTNHLCFSNKEGDFYKCAYTSENGDYCVGCIEDYYLGDIDHKCSLIEGCDISENENKCIQCYSEEWCLDLKTGKCEYNKIIEDENKKFYYKCNRTNEEGTECEICINGYILNNNGLCVDNSHCIEEKEDICQKCEKKEGDNFNYCLNIKNGLCENNEVIKDMDKKFYYKCNRTNEEGTSCEICLEGYYLNEDGLCIDNENCEEKEGNKCVKCKEQFCLNSDFGCVSSFYGNCLECNNILDFDVCSKCIEGFELNEFNICVETY